MESPTSHKPTDDGAPPPPETFLSNLPANPLQPMPSTWVSTETEFESVWHPAEDVTELEETLDQAIAHLKKVLRRVGNRSNIDVIKARSFLEQFN